MSLPPLRPVRFAEQNEIRGADLLAVVIAEGEIDKGALASDELRSLDRTLGGVVEQLVSLGDFEGKWLQSSHSLCPVKDMASRVLLVGAGSSLDEPANRARAIGLAIAEESTKRKAMRVAVMGSVDVCRKGSLREQLALGFQQGHYTFPKLNESDSDRSEREKPAELTFAGKGEGAANWNRVEVLGSALNFCRQLQDNPPNVVTPKFVAEQVRERAARLGLSVQVFGADKMREMGMNAILAVGGGSANEPQLVVVEYKPQNYKRTLALVGKGLTYDSGGYSIKPPEGQRGMKYDMSGSAVTLSSVMAIAELKLPVRVFGVAVLCENMLDAHSYRVDDILRTYSGKTIEILNTDAEGRVALADALAYTAQELKPDSIVEFSTLTGAIVVALGKYGAGLFTFNDPKGEFAGRIQCVAAGTGERVWPMPTWDEIAEDVKGTLADVNNLGATPRCAGSSCAAVFLREFVNGVPFAHVDIAGVADDNRIKGYPRKTGSGYGVQLAVELARMYSEEK